MVQSKQWVFPWNIVIFHSYVSHYQRRNPIKSHNTTIFLGFSHGFIMKDSYERSLPEANDFYPRMHLISEPGHPLRHAGLGNAPQVLGDDRDQRCTAEGKSIDSGIQHLDWE